MREVRRAGNTDRQHLDEHGIAQQTTRKQPAYNRIEEQQESQKSQEKKNRDEQEQELIGPNNNDSNNHCVIKTLYDTTKTTKTTKTTTTTKERRQDAVRDATTHTQMIQ